MTFSPANIWSDEKIERLRQPWLTDMSMADIAAEMGISRNSVIGKCHRLGLPARAFVPRLSEDELRRRSLERQRIYDSKRRIKLKPTVSKKMESPSLVPPPPYVGDLRIPFAELRDFKNHAPNQCRFIADEPPGPDYLACGNETRMGESYCGNCRERMRANHTNTPKERADHIRLGARQYLVAQRKRAA